MSLGQPPNLYYISALYKSALIYETFYDKNPHAFFYIIFDNKNRKEDRYTMGPKPLPWCFYIAQQYKFAYLRKFCFNDSAFHKLHNLNYKKLVLTVRSLRFARI